MSDLQQFIHSCKQQHPDEFKGFEPASGVYAA